MGRAIDLFITYRFIKLLTQPFEKTEAYKLGVIDKNGKRNVQPGTTRPTILATTEQKNSYTILHKLIFNIKKIFSKVPGLRTKVGTYAAALFLLKDTFREQVDDSQMFEKEFIKYLQEQGIEFDGTIDLEEVIGFGEILPKGEYALINDILNKEEEELTAKKGDKITAFKDQPPIDTILGVEIFPVVHLKTKEEIYISLEDIK